MTALSPTRLAILGVPVLTLWAALAPIFDLWLPPGSYPIALPVESFHRGRLGRTFGLLRDVSRGPLRRCVLRGRGESTGSTGGSAAESSVAEPSQQTPTVRRVSARPRPPRIPDLLPFAVRAWLDENPGLSRHQLYSHLKQTFEERLSGGLHTVSATMMGHRPTDEDVRTCSGVFRVQAPFSVQHLLKEWLVLSPAP